MTHLCEKRYAALLGGTLPPEEARALAAHLDGECEVCERFLAGLETVDDVDALADATLTGTAGAAAGNDLEFARIQRALRPTAPARRRLGVAAAAATVLLVAGLGVTATRLAGPGPASSWDGTKGAAPAPIPVRLRFLRLSQDGSVMKGISGEAADREASLLFEVDAAQSADVLLARADAMGGVELIWRRRVPAGRTAVSVDGRPAAYPLDGLGGPQRFLLFASDAPLDEARARSAAASLAPPHALRADSPALEGLTIDLVEVPVR
jgi:hypothetical protein